MKSSVALLTLWIAIIVEGVSVQKESPVATPSPARKDSQPKSSALLSDLSIPIPVYIPFEKSATMDKKLSQMDSPTNEKKGNLEINKENEKSEDGSTTTTENSNIGITEIEVTEASIIVAVPETSEDMNKKCLDIICKIPPNPNEAQCSVLAENPAVSTLGPAADCCPFLICTKTDGSFFVHYAGAHVEPRQNPPSFPSQTPNSPQMVMTQFFAGSGIPPWQNNQFGGFRATPPAFPNFGLLTRPVVSERNTRPFAGELQISMGRRVELPLSMSFQRQQTFQQQPPFEQSRQQIRQPPRSQSSSQQNVQLQPTMDKDPQHPAWNDIFRERRSGPFNGNPAPNQFIPFGYPAPGGLPFLPEFREPQPLRNFF